MFLLGKFLRCGYYDEYEYDKSLENKTLLVKFDRAMSFYISYDNVNFAECDEHEKMVEDMLKTWFDRTEEELFTKYSLFDALSDLSVERRKYHTPQWFNKNTSSVRFQYKENQIVPFRYTIKNIL